MKGIIKIALFIICILLLSIALTKPLLAGTSISGTATCKVPFILVMPDGTKLAVEETIFAEETIVEQKTNIADNNGDDDSLTVEQDPNFIMQQEEKISEDNKEVKLINTVCAR